VNVYTLSVLQRKHQHAELFHDGRVVMAVTPCMYTLAVYPTRMVTLMLVDGNRGDRRSVAVARRLREELAGQQISVAEVARRLGVTQQKLSRRMTGHTPFDVDELDAICRAASISFDYITTGIRAVPTPPNYPSVGYKFLAAVA
jgi:DNA-binding Xre family transcriptional regulator